MRPVLQNRWKMVSGALVYFGLRAYPHTFRWKIRLTSREGELIRRMDGSRPLDFSLTPRLRSLLRQGVIVDAAQKTKTPASFEEAAFCSLCAANTYTIPGLELDKNGLCPMCAWHKRLGRLRTVLPVVKALPKAKESRYDAAIFYTGGKDSSYLLWLLAKKMRLRVLALTWKTPFMSENALQSIENAKKRLPDVDFRIKEAPPQELAKIYEKAYALQGNTCICPSVAYLLFYPMLVRERVPCLVLGNEPAQARNLLFNGMAPPVAFLPAAQTLMRLAVNAGRICMLKRPLKKGQPEMLFMVRRLTEKPGRFGYRNELVDNICTALSAAPDLLKQLRRAVSESERTGGFPALFHIDFHEQGAEGVYRWSDVKTLLSQELDWVDAPEEGRELHTSCQIERCKEYTQFQRFLKMESRTIPFSAIETALASAEGSVTRAEAIAALKMHSGFLNSPPPEMETMCSAFAAKLKWTKKS